MKVKCKICGKVGLADDNKGLREHLRLSHNECVSKKYNKDTYFEPTDSDIPLDFYHGGLKKYMKNRNKKWTNWKIDLKETKTTKNPFAKIIYTPMGNKR